MISIRKFNFEDSTLMKQAHNIRHEVFVIGQKCPKNLEYEFEEQSTHFIILNNKKAVATARHRKTKTGYKLERFAVLKEYRGYGYGKNILEAILNDLKSYKGLIYLHAQVQVQSFYEKLGFKKEGNIFKEAGIMHYKMILNKD
tara:strand:+ start:691 stop:1119 length:429 start_codon:yes stop_codon:yes gene_type:complete